MDEKDIYYLKQPAKNRGVHLEILGDGKISLNGNVFELEKDAEEYLQTIERKDI